MEKETIEKEITKTSDRWVRIKKNNLEVTISSPYKEDKIETMVDKADQLIEKHSENKDIPSYAQ